MAHDDYEYAEYAGLLHDEADPRSDEQRDLDSLEQAILAMEAAQDAIAETSQYSHLA